MTALLASLGLLPAAMSHAIGSDTQRPFAIVIIGGLISSTLLTLLILPTLYELVHRWFAGTRAMEGEEA
jgi:cobalt-zinc-cadmium resistance protein CzcA